MKTILIIGGLFLLIFTCIIPGTRVIQEFDVQNNGELVKASITYIPICIGTKTSNFMKFRYDGEIFTKRVGCSFADDHKVGEPINLKHKEGTAIFLFEQEDKSTELVSIAILGLVGIVSIVYGLKK